MADPIVEELKAERHRQGVSLQRLGEQLGRKSYQTVWQWESETHDPSLSNLRQWAGVLGYELRLVRREAVTS